MTLRVDRRGFTRAGLASAAALVLPRTVCSPDERISGMLLLTLHAPVTATGLYLILSAEQPFREHDAMLLRLEDFASFVANWDDKASNLERIAEELNLGLDSFVFLDDSPAERAQVQGERK